MESPTQVSDDLGNKETCSLVEIPPNNFFKLYYILEPAITTIQNKNNFFS